MAAAYPGAASRIREWVLRRHWSLGNPPCALKGSRGHRVCSISVGCSRLAWCLSDPAPTCMRECAHFIETEQPRDLRYMQLAVIEVTNCQIAPQLLKYFSEVQPFVRKLSGQRPLAHSQTASNVIHHHPSMRKQRRYRVLNSRALLACITSSIGYRRFAIFHIEIGSA